MSVYVDVIRYRELFGSLFRRDIRAKYRGSFLGLGWSLLHPLVLMLVYLLVFSVLWRVAEVGSDDYWLFLLCGLPAIILLLWARARKEPFNPRRIVRRPKRIEVAGQHPSEHYFQSLAGIGFDAHGNFTKLSRTTGLFFMPVDDFLDRFLYGLLVRHLGDIQIDLYTELAFEFSQHHVHVDLPHAGEDDLLGL